MLGLAAGLTCRQVHIYFDVKPLKAVKFIWRCITVNESQSNKVAIIRFKVQQHLTKFKLVSIWLDYSH